MVTDFRNTFADTLSDELVIKRYLNIPSFVGYVGPLACEKFVWKNRLLWNLVK